MKNFHKFNFFKHTYCEFELKSLNFFKQREVHFKSKSGSLYFYTEKGVYRYSNHWGRVANCKWKINGIEAYKNQIYYVGYAKWSDFYPLNSKEKDFYITIEAKTNEQKINNHSSTIMPPYSDDIFLIDNHSDLENLTYYLDESIIPIIRRKICI